MAHPAVLGVEGGDELVGGLPLGWKQKLSFSVAMLHEPKIVFLDEPTGGVDPITRRQFWEMIYAAAARGTTVFVTTHYMDEADKLCNRVAIVDHGKLVALDAPDALKASIPGRSPDDTTLDDVFVHYTGRGLRDALQQQSAMDSPFMIRRS